VPVNAADPTTTPRLLAREPFLDHDGRPRGYELAFATEGADVPSEQATAGAILAAAADRDLAAVTRGLPAWLAVSREFLLELDPLPLAPGRVVLQLDGGAPVDDALLDRVRRLRAEGHPLALDGFLPRPEVEPLLAHADFLKVDLAAFGLAGLRAVMDRLPYERPVVVVTNVETPDQRDACVRRGVDLLQGFFFERPRLLAHRAAPIGSVDRLRALIALRGRPSFEEVERVVAGDPGLTVRLLRFANSAAVGSRRTFSSVRDAMLLLGSERVRQFLLLVLLGELGDGRPALVSAAVLRGRLCEELARERGLPMPDVAFTAGVLSVVDALLDQPMVEVVRTLPLTAELRWALLARSGDVGEVLDAAIRIERNRAGAGTGRFNRLGDVAAWADRAVTELV